MTNGMAIKLVLLGFAALASLAAHQAQSAQQYTIVDANSAPPAQR
jgi:hypothetical protein